MGTLAYMPPEQLRGQTAQAPSDVWALGVVLYEMAHGTRPFQGQTGFELSAAILNEAPAPLPSSIPAALQAVVARCLEKEPGQRYQTGSEVRAALEVIQTGGNLPQATPQTRPASRHRHLAHVVTGLTRRRASGSAPPRSWPALGSRPGGCSRRRGRPVAGRAAVREPGEGRRPRILVRGGCREPDSTDVETADRSGSAISAQSSTSRGSRWILRTAGSQLGVETILAGSIERQGARLLISARLVDVATGRELWTNATTATRRTCSTSRTRSPPRL